MRCRPGLNSCKAFWMLSCETPTVRASAAAASALETLWGTVGVMSFSSHIIAASMGSETNALSTNNSSTTPISPGAGVSSEKKTFRPLNRLARNTTCSSSAFRTATSALSKIENLASA